ncbi:MAG: hypothetical protein J2P41_23815, partial [Blastocatellia bacterium]|nr:hypothetical protein [Blastocatellia bacterium]
NLRPVYSESQENYETDILIDGKFLRAFSFDEGTDSHVSNPEFIYRGYGKQIYIGFTRDHYKEIEQAQIQIYVEDWLQKFWRERLSRSWKSYGEIIIGCLILFPIVLSAGLYLNKWSQRNKAEEKKLEMERQALILNAHNKSLELMREIDQRAQQKSNEIMARNLDELQKKILYWRTRAYTESYFLNSDLRKSYAALNREKIINQLEKEWTREFLEIAQDLALGKALKEQEPGVMHWIEARQEVVNLAHQLTWSNQPVIDAYYEEVPGRVIHDGVQDVGHDEEQGQGQGDAEKSFRK